MLSDKALCQCLSWWTGQASVIPMYGFLLKFDEHAMFLEFSLSITSIILQTYQTKDEISCKVSNPTEEQHA